MVIKKILKNIHLSWLLLYTLSIEDNRNVSKLVKKKTAPQFSILKRSSYKFHQSRQILISREHIMRQ